MSNLELGMSDRAWWQERIERGEHAGRRNERFLAFLWSLSLLLIDASVVVGAFLVAHWLRFVAVDGLGSAAVDIDRYVVMAFAISVVSAALFTAHGLYDVERRIWWPKRLYVIVSVISVALALSVTLNAFRSEDGFSRLWFAGGWALSVLALGVWRALADRIHAWIETAAGPSNRLLIVGANALGEDLARELADRYRIVGYVDNGSDLNGHSSLPLLGPIARLDELVNIHGVDEVVIALPPDRQEQAASVIDRGFRHDVAVKYVPNLGNFLPQRFEIRQLAGHPSIGFAPVARVSWLKRGLDIVVGSLITLALSPLLLVVAVAIKLDSPGPVFYWQRRVGKDGRGFAMLKFRSMRQNADRYLEELRDQNEATGPLFKIRQDPRVTRVGRILRRLSIDELPQLYNVIHGEMSLVGPRPPIPAEVDEYDEWQLGRLRATPGMTGLWQVSGRSEVPFHDMVRLDLHYIRNWSLGLDLEILLRTVPAVLSNRGAY